MSEDVFMARGLAKFGKDIYPRMTRQSVFDVNKKWKRISGRKIYKDWRDEFREANGLGKGQVDLNHWWIEKSSWIGKKFPWLVNNPINLNPMRWDDNRWDLPNMPWIKRRLDGAPDWARLMGGAWLIKVFEEIQTLGMVELARRCECQKEEGVK